MNQTNDYSISKNTGLFIDAVKAFEDAKGKFYDALLNFYGEETASNIYAEEAKIIEEGVNKAISKHLYCSIVDRVNNVGSNSI